MPLVTFEMAVEELASRYPRAVNFLTQHQVRCIRCGEPLWCSVGELFQQDEVSDPQKLLDELNDFLLEGEE